MNEPGHEIVEGLWARLRNTLIALDRVDRLDTSSQFVDWVETFQRDEAQIEATTRDWVLRALHCVSDPLNYQILRALQDCDSMSIAELVSRTNATRVDLTERIRDLAQMGFVAQTLETDNVQTTRTGAGTILWIESLREQMAERVQAGLVKDNPPPKFHRPISNL